MPDQPRSESSHAASSPAITDPARLDCLGYHSLGGWSKRDGNLGIGAYLLRANLGAGVGGGRLRGG